MKRCETGFDRRQWFEGLKYAEQTFELLADDALAKVTVESLVAASYAFNENGFFEEGIEDYVEYRRTVLAKLSP